MTPLLEVKDKIHNDMLLANALNRRHEMELKELELAHLEQKHALLRKQDLERVDNWKREDRGKLNG